MHKPRISVFVPARSSARKYVPHVNQSRGFAAGFGARDGHKACISGIALSGAGETGSSSKWCAWGSGAAALVILVAEAGAVKFDVGAGETICLMEEVMKDELAVGSIVYRRRSDRHEPDLGASRARLR